MKARHAKRANDIQGSAKHTLIQDVKMFNEINESGTAKSMGEVVQLIVFMQMFVPNLF